MMTTRLPLALLASSVLVLSLDACHLVSGVNELEVATVTATGATGGMTTSSVGGSNANSTTSTGTAVTSGGGGAAASTGAGGASSVGSGSTGSGGAAPIVQPSCAGDGTLCGTAMVDCCTSDLIPGGVFNRNFDAAFPATVSPFRLDRFEVTVGRFRKFVAATSDESNPWTPPKGSGKHAHLNQGKGLTNEIGWASPSWNLQVPVTKASWDVDLACATDTTKGYQTWTPSAGANEKKPINGVSWFEAYAFCIWDGGFLPTDNELDFAAATTMNFEYPWGPPDAPDSTRAVFNCNQGCNKTSAAMLAVGSLPKGTGFFGSADLAGNVAEWSLDVFSAKSALVKPCTDCAVVPPSDVTPSTLSIQRGGSFGTGTSKEVGKFADRQPQVMGTRGSAIGVRCAYQP